MRTFFSFLFVILLLPILLFTNQAFAAEVHIVGGQLIGASAVKVGNEFYDVSFVDSSAEDLWWNGTTWEFDFDSELETYAAAEALLEQVLLDGTLGAFDSKPELTCGISNDSYAMIYVPYEAEFNRLNTSMRAHATMNHEIEELFFDDHVAGKLYMSSDWDVSSSDYATYAVWTRATPPSPSVPEPNTLMLVGCGLLGIAGVCRRRSNI